MAKILNSDEFLNRHLVIVHRNQLNGFIGKYFTNDLCKTILGISKACFHWEADSIILFLNKSKGSFICPCFLPTYANKESLLQNAGKVIDIEKCIALPPRYLRTIQNLPEGIIYSFGDLASRCGYWEKEYLFGVLNEKGEDDMYRMSTVPFSDIRIKKETINFEEEQLDLYKSLVGTNPQNNRLKEAQNILVRQITDHRKELDLVNGFTQLQYDAYDYALRMPDVIDRKFDAGRFEPFIEMVNSFFNKIHKSLQNTYALRIADAGTGSAVLFIDLIPQHLNKEEEKDWKKGKEHFRKTVSAMPVLTRIGDVRERVNNFCKKAELDPEQAKEILKTVQKIFPKSIDKEGAIEIYSRSEKEPIAKFDQDGHLNFNKAKKDLNDSLKPEEETVVSGFLGLIVGWESEDPRFVIETDEKRRITIKYDKEKTDEVKARFKKKVKLEKTKEGRSWRFLKWK